jgi:ketosteroid isomerase-like protein
MAEDPGAALIAELFDLFNEANRSGEFDRARVERCWHAEGRHVTRFAALEGRAFEGHDGIEEFLRESREQFERFEVRLERVMGEGARRVAIYTVDAITRDARVPMSQRLGMDIELRDGRAWRTTVHADPRSALQAAGLDPASV